MSNYTLEFRYLVDDENFEIFDFDYELYDNDLKPKFEKDFKEYFYFREIGHETVGRFKKALQIKLNQIAYRYKEYYKTVIALENEDMMMTKDLKETFIREVNGESSSNVNSSDNSNLNGNGKNVNKFSLTPKQGIESLDNHITNATVDENNTFTNSQSNSNSETTNRVNNRETTTFISQGDLGVTSSGLLIQGWRDVIVSIHEKMFQEDLEELFFQLI